MTQEYCQTHSCGTDESASEVYVNFTANPPEQFALQELFDCSNPKVIRRRKTGGEAFWHTAGNRIILIGGTFQHSNDFYNTPVGLLSGLELNAYAIASELDGSGIRAVRQPWAVLLDFTVGYLVLLVVRKTEHRRWLGFRWLIKSNEPRLAILVSVALWIIAFYIIWLFANAYVLGVAGVILGILLDPFANTLQTIRESLAIVIPKCEMRGIVRLLRLQARHKVFGVMLSSYASRDAAASAVRS